MMRTWGPKSWEGAVKLLDRERPGGRQVVRVNVGDPLHDELWLVEYTCLGGDGQCTLMPLRKVGLYTDLRPAGHSYMQAVVDGPFDEGTLRILRETLDGGICMVEYDTTRSPARVKGWAY